MPLQFGAVHLNFSATTANERGRAANLDTTCHEWNDFMILQGSDLRFVTFRTVIFPHIAVCLVWST